MICEGKKNYTCIEWRVAHPPGKIEQHVRRRGKTKPSFRVRHAQVSVMNFDIATKYSTENQLSHSSPVPCQNEEKVCTHVDQVTTPPQTRPCGTKTSPEHPTI